MPVGGKVFSYEGNQYSFEKQLQVKKKKEVTILPRKRELISFFKELPYNCHSEKV